jgi:hypothetical protein
VASTLDHPGNSSIHRRLLLLVSAVGLCMSPPHAPSLGNGGVPAALSYFLEGLLDAVASTLDHPGNSSIHRRLLLLVSAVGLCMSPPHAPSLGNGGVPAALSTLEYA